MINCIDFRREVLTDPTHLSGTVDEHRHQCEACYRYCLRMSEQDEAITAALLAPVPADLADNIKMQAGTLTKSKERRSSYKWGAAVTVAASIIVAVMLYLPAVPEYSKPDDFMATKVLSHIAAEPLTFQINPVTEGQMAYVMGVINMHSNQSLYKIGSVSFAGNCVIDGKLAAHLVLRTDIGPITLLIMPDNPVASVSTAKDGRWQAEVVSFAGGSLAVIGPRHVKLKAYQEQISSVAKGFLL